MTDHLPNLGRENEMLAAMGHASMDDLFIELPELPEVLLLVLLIGMQLQWQMVMILQMFW